MSLSVSLVLVTIAKCCSTRTSLGRFNHLTLRYFKGSLVQPMVHASRAASTIERSYCVEVKNQPGGLEKAVAVACLVRRHNWRWYGSPVPVGYPLHQCTRAPLYPAPCTPAPCTKTHPAPSVGHWIFVNNYSRFISPLPPRLTPSCPPTQSPGHSRVEQIAFFSP